MVTVADVLTQYMVELAGGKRSGFSWVPEAARYRDNTTGRFVAESKVLETAELYAETKLAPTIDDLTNRMIDGKIDLATWQERMAAELKSAYMVEAMVGRGGKLAMTPADYGRIGGRLSFEFRKLNTFALEIKTGTLSPAEIRVRARMYANGAQVAYWDGKSAAMKEGGYTESKRDLSPAEHCNSCIEYASRGWRPLGELPPPGIGSECMHNCKCRMRFRKGKKQVIGVGA